MKLAANVSTLFKERPFLDRFQAAYDAGFRAVEAQRPYEASADDIAERLALLAMPMTLFNIPAPNAALPGARDDFLAQFDKAMDYLRVTQCRRLHVQPGIIPTDVSHSDAEETFIDNLRYAADALAPMGVDVLLEPINSKIDMPGYFFSTTNDALRIMELADRPNLRLQYDIYHMQVMEGDLARTIERLLPRIGHIQLADHPGRHEPGTGEINFPWLLRKIDDLGYDGFIGCEYNPSGATLDSLAWAKPYL